MRLIHFVAIAFIATSCTITMMNTSTSGKSDDAVDAASDASADIRPKVTVTPV